MKKNLAMYFLVNKDIAMSKGKVSGQVAHATMRYMYEYAHCIDIEPTVKDYMMNTSEKKIILACSEKDLLEYEKTELVSVRDSGLTELEANTLTCVCLGILDKENILDNKLKRLRLYK